MLRKIGQYIQIIIGVMMTSFAISVFYTPNKIVNGGLSGISTILFHIFNIQPGISFAVINAIWLLIALKLIGKNFVFNTIAGAALTSLFVQLFSYLPSFSGDMFLTVIFGSIIYGIGIGITFACDASTGGTDILGRILQHFFPHISIGRLLLIVDGTVIACSLVLFKNIELALWGAVSMYISTSSVDWLIRKLNISKLAFVVSQNGEDIAQKLVASSPRGVTIIDSVGAYTMQDNKVLMCALKEKEIIEFQNIITELDENAFIIYSESQSILGNGFHLYR